MAYNDTPLATDLLSDTQAPIRENFQLLKSAQVVDEGTTVDGDYWRLENGKQICVLYFSETFSATDTLNGLYRSSLITKNLPVPFVNDNYSIAVSGEVFQGGLIVDARAVPDQTGSFDVRAAGLQSFSSESKEIKVVTIGRWK